MANFDCQLDTTKNQMGREPQRQIVHTELAYRLILVDHIILTNVQNATQLWRYHPLDMCS